MPNPKGRVFPHVAEAKRAHFDTGQSLHLLWTRWFELQETVDSANQTIRDQAALIEQLRTDHDSLNARVLTTTPAQGTVSAPPGTGTPPGGGGGGGGEPSGVPDLFEQIVTARAAYGATMSADECVELLNTVARNNAGDGFGLLSKTTGNYGLQPATANRCSVDILYHLPTNSLWDALIDAGHRTGGPGRADPQWSFVSTNVEPSRFVTPV